MAVSEDYYQNVILKKPFGWEYVPKEELDYHFGFEEINPFYWHRIVANDHWDFVYYVGALYLVAIFGIQFWMRDRPAYNLKIPLFYWNLSLGIFSILGFLRTVPRFLQILGVPGGFYESICLKKHGDISFSYWSLMFILSKFWELGDTVFIVLRKRKLVFLQWYHHLITMTVAWIISPYMEPVNRWYMVLNYGVHSLMYPYFALRAINVRIPNYVANLITTLQLTQMIIGFGVNVLSVYYQQTGTDCVRYPASIRAFGLVYGSFIILFGKLFYDSVIRKGRQQKELSKKVD